MKWNEMNIFRIFFPLSCLGVLTEGMKVHSFVWEFKWEGIEWVGGNTHSSLFLENLKFSFPLKSGGMVGNEIRFNDFFTKTLKIPLYIQPFILK